MKRHPPFCCLSLGLILLTLNLSALAKEPVLKQSNDLAKYDALIKPKDRRHWAFQPVRQPAIPDVKDTDWVRNPIDRFILAKLEEKGWRPAPAAEPRALMRRLYLDLLGLPPTPAEQEAFLKDSSATAVDRLVGQLLSRPGYGERWARHWLDLVRYAETNGYERDGIKPSVWRYRDYVIRAFNDDKPFDRFILEQLAGDELTDANAETLIATSFYRLGPWDDEPADPQEDRFDQLDDMVSTTSQVFLGLTLGCARCHNHKFEPLTQHDYYRMVAIFNPLQRPQAGRNDLDRLAGSRAELEAVVRRDQHIAAQMAAGIGGQSTINHITGLGRPALAASTWIGQEEQVRRIKRETPDLPRGYFMYEPSPKPPVAHLLLRGKASRPGPEVQPGLPAVLVKSQPDFLPPSKFTTQRRLSLARWLASPDNPLTARVLVNRVWQFHFGEGLVRTPSDFGTLGDAPTHPELLDWLAHEFVKEGWSIKKLHRLILASNTYRMSKRGNAEYAKDDPENRLLWRFPYRRLEAEAIRDSMLAASGKLNSQMYGPSMYPEVPSEALEGSSDPKTIWKPFDEASTSRRTIYAHVKRSMIVPMLEVLDFCDTARSSAKRNVTTVPSQALTLLNGDFVNRQARHFAQRLVTDVGLDPEKQIDRAYALALCRPPTAKERTALSLFLTVECEQLVRESSAAEKAAATKNAKQRALEQLCRVVFNLNEFVYPD